MHNDLLVGLAIVITLSISAQWLAWRTKLPSILLLLTFGIIAGSFAHVVDTDELMGDLLFPVVSLSVAIILFEGGLTLRLDDLPEIGSVIRNLITVGVGITWLISTLAARLFLDLDWSIALLLGAILVVTGPTVVIPLLNQIRPSGRASSILRWEGIIIDPVGAVLAVLVFEEILIGDNQVLIAGWGLIKTVLIGGIIGWGSARLMIEAFSRYWVPDNLHNPVVLTVLTTAFAASNTLQAESGLLTVTIMGIIMANQKRFDVIHIVEFKENLQVLLISSLFILLGARLDLDALANLGLGAFFFLLTLLFLARPLSVWVSTYGSDLDWREKLFIAWMAPRGIVAAAVASIFALELSDHGYEGAESLVPLTFSVIIGTVIIYGLTAGLLANRLGLVKDSQGVLIIGAHGWARKIALSLQNAGIRVILVDTNIQNIEKATVLGLEVHQGNILNEPVIDDINLSGIGKMLAMTPNDEVNSLASLHFKGILGEQSVFQLPRQNVSEDTNVLFKLGGQNMFGTNITYEYLATRFNMGAALHTLSIDDMKAYQENSDMIEPLFTITDDRKLVLRRTNEPPQVYEGYTVIGLIEGTDKDAFID